MIATEELKQRLVRLSNQINILSLSVNQMHRNMDELIVQFNDLVARCEQAEKEDLEKAKKKVEKIEVK